MKNKLLLLSVTLLATCALSACQKANSKDSSVKKAAVSQKVDRSLYRNFYEIFTSSFADSNHDGEGDLNGVTQHLDYLNTGKSNSTTDLKVQGLWMTPIFASPSYHGYDVTNYEEINPKFGTMADFENLIAQAKKRGIAVILDMPFNHTATDNVWFQKALAGDKKYVAYYNWSDTAKEGYSLASNGKYYESEFDKSMPDLNLANPEVKKEIAKITKFWLDKGVSGFRLDAVGFYFSNDDKKTTAFTKWLTDTVKKQNPKAYLVGEVFSTASAIDDIYPSGIDSLFDFPNALQSSSSPINSALVLGEGSLFGQQMEAWDQEIHADNPKAIDAPFLSNHDTDRSATLLSSLSMQKMAAQTYLLMPGNPFIYYGEELGLTGSGIDQNKRLPMPWNAAGTDSPKADISVPGATEIATTDGGSVAQQEANPNSLINWYKKILRVKAKYPEIATDRLKNISVSEESLSVINYGKDLTIINNFSDTENVTMKLPKSVVGTKITDQLSVSSSQAKLTDGKLTIPAYSTVILKK